jgi:glycosyltransferase involved in cell wall biosynthesis
VGTDTSLFTPLSAAERPAAIARLASMHRPGGKTPAQRAALQRSLDQGQLTAVRDYWEAYDHNVEDADLPALLERLPVEHDLLLFVGAMTYGKGIQSLIAAMPGILARRPNTHLVLVGSGTYREVLEALCHALSSGNLELFDRLVAQGQDLERAAMSGPLEDLAAYAAQPAHRQLLARCGPQLRERVHFLGRLDHPRLRCIFPCCRLAVFPSVIKEASPLVFLEALAGGVLPCGSYHSGLRDGLDDLQPHLPPEIWQRMRLPVEPGGRIEGILDNLCGLLERLEREDLRPRLRQLAVDRYDWKAIASALVRMAQSIG